MHGPSDPSARDAHRISLHAVQAAALRLGDALVRTPVAHAQTLSQLYGAELWFKYENLQFTGSFKERGALHKLLGLSQEQRERGVIAASAGNHAQAVAHHARRLGIKATIVMPLSAPFLKVSNTEVLGAQVLQAGNTVDEANQRARELAHQHGLVQVHPFDDVDVILGQGTAGLELCEQVPELDTVVVPIGGGGLISGVATVVKALTPKVRVVGVQSALFSNAAKHLHRARAAQSPAEPAEQSTGSLGPFGADTLADGIAVKSPGVIATAVMERCVDDILTVSEASLERACNAYFELEKTVVEGAGAAALAAVMEHAEQFSGQRVACLVSGGNIDPRVMADTVLRGLVHTGRLARLRVDVRDLPGSLAEITRIVAEAGANIVDVRHERIFLATPSLRTRLSLELATRHRQHAENIAHALLLAGHRVELV